MSAQALDFSGWWDKHQDLVWGALIGSLVTLLVGWIFWRLAEKPRRLDWTRGGCKRILDLGIGEYVGAPLSVRIGGAPVEKPNLVNLSVINTGKIGIKREDLTKPVLIDFGEARIVHGTILASSAATGPELKLTVGSPSRASLSFALLNQGMNIDLQFVTDGPMGYPTLRETIVSQVRPMRPVTVAPRQVNTILRPMAFLLAVFFLLMGFVSLASPDQPGYLFAAILMWALSIASFWVALLAAHRLALPWLYLMALFSTKIYDEPPREPLKPEEEFN